MKTANVCRNEVFRMQAVGRPDEKDGWLDVDTPEENRHKKHEKPQKDRAHRTRLQIRIGNDGKPSADA